MSNFCQQGDITKIFIVDTGSTGSTGTDIYVTGGTYFDGTLTLGRNDGVSISIPGFLTGSTSADIYVTGGTYFGGTLTLGRNDGITVPITGFSTTSIFTGNTSASCITDLYITNLHGCSPITIHDSIQSVGSTASGLLSTAFGNGSVAQGDYSHAEGISTSATAAGSHAEGSGTTASGIGSHVEGIGSKAIGNYSHTEGSGTYSGAYAYLVSGYSGSNIVLNPSYGDVTSQFTSSTVFTYDLNGVVGQVLNFSTTSYNNITSATTVAVSGTVITIAPYYILPNPRETGNYTPLKADQIFGLYSHAEGVNTQAIGNISHSEGEITQAIGYASHAEGYNTQANGVTSHAEGNRTIAADYSHAEGLFSEALGVYSHAEGQSSIASGAGSHAQNFKTTASGQFSHAEGHTSRATGFTSHAEGFFTLAANSHSHSEGEYTIARGITSHAEGSGTTASGNYSHAEGRFTIASGNTSHAEGLSTQAIGEGSHSQGFNTIANGEYSFASGSGSTASGIASFIHSSRSVVTGNRSVVLGGQGISGTSNDFVYVPSLNINSQPTLNNSGTQILTRNSGTGNIEYRDASTISGGTSIDTFTTGFTFTNDNTLTIGRNQGQPPLSVTINNLTLTGLTVAGAVSATTYLNLPPFTGNTSASCITDLYITNLHGCSPITIWDPIVSLSSISATTYYGDGSNLSGIPDYYVTGGTYSDGTLTLNRQNGSVTIPGFLTGSTGTGIDTYVTGFTYNDANRLTISQNQGQPPLNVFINTFTGITTHYLDVNTNVTETSAVGRLAWNDVDGTLDLGLKGGNVTLQIGQEQVVRVVNKTGADLLESQYKVVRIRSQAEGGSQGQRLAIVLAQANNDPNSVDTLGIVTENIDNNQEGFITSSGLVRNINTTGSLQSETWLDGDVLYLSPITAGELTKVKPIAPQHTVIMGYVVYAHVNNGKIFVKVDNGYELDELHNVRISGETNNQVLSYDSTQDVWVNRTLPAFITGFTDNFVTGGTYSSGTLTLNRQNGSVIITGFTTSSSSGGTGIDTYVTGFTYSNNNLSINQNQGQSPLSVTINNFTGLTVNGSLSASTYLGLPSFTFTGNTSASCISNLYVSNIYGCSPITIHDSIKSVGSSATGITSFAFGNTTVAAGDYSHAEGDNTQAIGTGSHAEGSSTITNGYYSHAEGDSAQAIGGYSHAEGYLTKTIGDYSHTEGNGTLTGQYFYTTIGVSSGVITLDGTYGDVSTEFTTTGIILEDSGTFTWYQIDQGTPPYFNRPNTIITLTDTSVNRGTNVGIPGVFQPTTADILLGSIYSHAEGEGTIAIGSSSHTEGGGSTAIGDYSHAEGKGTITVGTWSHAEGNRTTAIGIGSHAEGDSTTASGDYSHAEGDGSSANQNYSHAEGTSTADGEYSHSEGTKTIATGIGSHSEGDSTNAIGDYSHAEGKGTITVGTWSHAEGYYTQANGNYSHSQGTSTVAGGDYSFASGSGSTAQGALSFVHSINSVAAGEGTVVLGGVGISGTTPNMVYVSTLNINSTPVSNSGETQVLVRNSSTGDIEYNSNIQAQIDALKVEEVNLQDIGTGLPASTYTIVLNAKYARTINELTVIAGAGTCTLTMNINGTPVTGISGVSVTTTGTTYTATATNAVVVGDTVTMVTTSNSGLANLQATIKTTR